MSEAENFGRRFARWAADNPRSGKAVSLLLVIVIFGPVGYLLWQDIAQGKWHRLLGAAAFTFFTMHRMRKARRAEAERG